MKSIQIMLSILGIITHLTAQVQFIGHTLTPHPDYFTDNPTDVLTFDADNDGDTDIITASFVDGKIAWHENDGQQNFIQHVITTNASGVTKLDMVDMEGDGDIDLLSDASIDNKVYWYENDSLGNFTPHLIFSDDDFVLEGNNWATYTVHASDLDNDGDMDALHGGWSDPVIRWHENDGSNTSFTHHVLDTLGERVQIIAADLDGDNDSDILATCQYPSVVVWYENDSSRNFSRHTISDSDTSPRIIICMDIDKDGDLDIVTSHYRDNVTWYENDGQQNFTTRRIPDSPTCNTIYVADLDNDDDWDIITGDPDDNNAQSRFGWLENDGQQNFTYHNVTYNILWSSAVWGDDLDKDGDIDIMFSSLYDDKVAWYESYFKDSHSAHADSIAPIKKFVKDVEDILSISSNIINPYSSSLRVEAHIFNEHDAVEYYVPLSHQGDDLWNAQWNIPEGERHYQVRVKVTDMDSATVTWSLPRLSRSFTTIGPLVFADSGYVEYFYDEKERLQYFHIILKNEGIQTTATTLVTKLFTDDPRVESFLTSSRPFPDLAPGMTDTTAELRYYLFKFAEGYNPESTIDDPISFSAVIYSDGIDYWQDSLNFYTIVSLQDELLTTLPAKLDLQQNYPNPFNPFTMISYQLSVNSDVSLLIYNTLGQQIRTLLNSRQIAGNYKITWDGRDDFGNVVPSAVYFYRLKAGSFEQTRKMVLLR